jgi:uncharacterized membrane protein
MHRGIILARHARLTTLPRLMRKLVHHWRARPRMLFSVLAGWLAALVVPDIDSLVTRTLLGWNVGVWLYLVLIGLFMLRADHGRLRKVAQAHAEGSATVSAVVAGASLASLVAIVLELAAAKAGARHAVPHALMAIGTVAGSWLLLPTLFTLNYASLYYRVEQGAGLAFPGAGDDFRPNYLDFGYFSFTIAVALQTSDVAVTTPAMRRLVLAQSLLAFVFNTTILAFTINIAASLF